MKIEKKKVVKSSKLSHFTKSAVAAALGIATSIGATACDDSMSATSDDNKKQEPEPTCGETACGEQFSSSSYTDISSSGEHLSSEAIEALSSAKQPLSSSSVDPLISSGVPLISSPSSSDSHSSSSVEKPSSSSYEPIIEAGILPPYEDNPDVNSSSDMAPVSSANVPSSSSEVTEQSSSSSDIDIKPVPIDTIDLNPRVYLCPDGTTSCLMVSMVTTFEHDDIQA